MRGICWIAVLLLSGYCLSSCSPLPAHLFLGDADIQESEYIEPDPPESDIETDTSGIDTADTEIAEAESDAERAESEADGEQEGEGEEFAWICPNNAVYCYRSADCPSGQVCMGGCCEAACTQASCDEGLICNPENGYCEYCGQDGEDVCPAGRCCNYAGFWYCGTCCVPACKKGERCVSGACQIMECPTDCGADYCCDAKHGFSCYDCTDGDAEIELDFEFLEEELAPGQYATCVPFVSTALQAKSSKVVTPSCVIRQSAFRLLSINELVYSAPTLFISTPQAGLLAIDTTTFEAEPKALGHHPTWLRTPHAGLLSFWEDGELISYRTAELLAGGAALARSPLDDLSILPKGAHLYRSRFADCSIFRVDTIEEDGTLTIGTPRGYYIPKRGDFPYRALTGQNVSENGFFTMWINDFGGSSTYWQTFAIDATNPARLGPAWLLFSSFILKDMEFFEADPQPIWSLAGGDYLLVEDVHERAYGWTGYYTPPDPPALFLRKEGAAPQLIRRLPEKIPTTTLRDWQGDTIWAVDGKDLIRYDFSSQSTLREAARATLDAPIGSLLTKGDRVFATIGSNGVASLDMPADTVPSSLFSRRLALPFHDNVGDLFFAGGQLWAYVGDRLFALDTAHPESPDPLAEIPLSYTGPMVAKTDSLLIVGAYDGLDIIDLSAPGGPKRIYSGVPSGATNPTSRKGLRAPASGAGRLIGNTLYMALNTLTATDISDPKAPIRLWSLGELSFASDGTLRNPHSLQIIGDTLIAVYELNGEQTFVTFPAAAPSQSNATRVLTGKFEAVGWWGAKAVVLQTIGEQRVLQVVDFSDPLHPRLGKSVERANLNGDVSGITEKDGFLCLANYTTNTLHVLNPQDPTEDLFAIPISGAIEAFTPAPGGPQQGLYIASSCPNCPESPPYSLALYDVTACATFPSAASRGR